MNKKLTYQDRIDSLRMLKLIHTVQKHKIDGTDGYWDMDDKGIIPPPPGFVFKAESNLKDGKFCGEYLCGKNYRQLLETHPVYIDPMSSLAGGWMHSFYDIKTPLWNPEYDYSHLHERQKKYDLVLGIGGTQHFNVDYVMGLKQGFGGILDKINKYEKINKDKKSFYQAEKDVVLGLQNWIQRHADTAFEMAKRENRPEIKASLLKMAEANSKIVNKPASTFYEACQWTAWFVMAAVMYNFSGAGGALDKYLYPFYKNDKKAGIINDEEAMFHLACLLVKDNQYYQIGGTDEKGKDRTNELSFLVIEAAHRLKIPTNICLRVHKNLNPDLMKLSVKYLFEDKMGTPSYLGDESVNEGFIKNGYPVELARQREKTGCHWCGLPGREYTLNDIVKISFLAIFDIALRESYSDKVIDLTVDSLFENFKKHLGIAIDTIAEGIDFHLKYMHKVFPELILNLLCHGPIEKGLDASNNGVEYYNMCVDATGIATVADSFAAIDKLVGRGKKLSWDNLMKLLDTDFNNAENERLMLRRVPRYGSGGSKADEYAVLISKTFTELVKEKPTPDGRNMIPGLFSWANTIPMGKAVGASPNGRKAGAPINHGANPEPGFSNADSPTALANAVASVQCGYGNTAPLQLELDPMLGEGEGGVEIIEAFINSFMEMGGTLLNINILNKEKILKAHKDPSKYPDLIVRVTGFSAYFMSLSREFRQLVVDRIVEGL